MVPGRAGLAPWRGLHRDLRPAGSQLVSGFLAILIAFLPIAAASLPDLLWVLGVYDGSDYDDLVAVTADGSLPVAAMLPVVAPVVGRGGVPAAPSRPAGPARGAFLPRAPPSA